MVVDGHDHFPKSSLMARTASSSGRSASPTGASRVARLVALEYMLAEAFRMIYSLLGASEEQIEASHEELRQYLRG
jgi:hypothetical protein